MVILVIWNSELVKPSWHSRTHLIENHLVWGSNFYLLELT